MACSRRSASSCTSSQGTPTTSVRKRSIRRWREAIPLHFLENILGDLKQAGIISTRRGPEGGYKLTRPAADVSVADVIRAVEGPLASVRGDSPESLRYDGSAEPLQQVWIALRGNLRAVLETVSLDDLVRGKLPRSVAELARDPDAWARR